MNLRSILLTTLVSFVVPTLCSASLQVDIPVPIDDMKAKLGTWTAAESMELILADRKAWWDVQEEVRRLPEKRLQALYGPAKTTVPEGYVLPVHQHAGVGFSGLGYRGGERSYFLTISNIGGILVFPFGDNDFVSAIAIYLKTDADFVPLRRTSDYPARRQWELRRLDELQKYVRELEKGK